MKILGIESSADETAAAIVESAGRRRLRLLSNEIASSLDHHAYYGGIVPEIAARSHLEVITPVIDKALRAAKCDWADIDAIAVTVGPGLIGSLLIGVLTARTLAIAKQKPLYAINHVQAHTYACFITETSLPSYDLPDRPPEFPLLSLTVSGGHTQLVLFKSHGKYRLLGQTTDDAVGEAYDKVAKMLGLPYPGGPSVSQAAKKAKPNIKLPKARLENPYDFSFSGLKTAVLRAAQKLGGHDYTFPSTGLPETLSEAQKANLAASFESTAIETLLDGLKRASDEYQPASLVIVGGVAANQELRRQAQKLFPTLARPERSRGVIFPDIKLCTDNAAMIASMGFYQSRTLKKLSDPFTLEADPSLRM